MKYFYTLIFLTSFFNSYSQDVILKTNGKTIDAKIDEIGIDKIKYHMADNLAGPVFIVSKHDVSKITFENGFVQVIDFEEKSGLEEIKGNIVQNINKYGFERDSGKKAYKASFEDDFLRLIVLKKSGEESNDGDLFDFSTVYKFGRVDKRKDELAYINIWVSISTNEKKNKWDKYKLVMRVKGHKNADRIMKSLRDYNELLFSRN